MGFLHSQLFVTPKYPTGSSVNQTVIVTGSNVGLGLEAARHFVRLGAAKVILAVRNIAAGEKAKTSIEESTATCGICDVWELDLINYKSVQAFAERVAQLPRLAILIENAGIATTRLRVQRDMKVELLSTSSEETAKKYPSRLPHLSVVTSEEHAWTDLPEWKTQTTFQTLDCEETADMQSGYAASKLLQILLGRELASRLTDSGVILSMLQPGLCHSQWTREEESWINTILKLVLARSTEIGSCTLLAAALAGPGSHGAYMRDGIVDNGALSTFVQSGEGEKAQQKVWKEMAEILRSIQPDIM